MIKKFHQEVKNSKETNT